MLPLENVAAFAAASALLIAVPGPSVLFVIGRSMALGRVGGLVSVVGNLLGVLLQIALVAAGVGALVAQSAAAFTAVKLAGAAYLVYLGVQTIRHRHASVTALREAAEAGTRPTAAGRATRHGFSTRRVLLESATVGVTNPKSIVFFVAVLPQFVDYGSGAIPLQLALLGSVFAVIALAFDGAQALAAGTARDWFARRPARMSKLSATGGVMMIGLGGALALSGNKS